ncbi:hypothetical protein BZM27_35020 [Paraburkholderia steynii]|uniref:DUF2946 domain-containing protein n=1 Tax=Paraburkholderia steynii TaxID=1245441 RepID=A0A4R0XEB6_9BURK|nr:hypothetical protein BZM27_35020 [Paraburkholderia steynii]
MSFRHRTFVIAWLGIIAMFLIVLAPVVRQLSVSNKGLEDVFCTASRPATDHQPVQHDHFAACFYCDLLTHHTPVPFASLTWASTATPRTVAMTVSVVHFMPLAEFRPGRPRAPPA